MRYTIYNQYYIFQGLDGGTSGYRDEELMWLHNGFDLLQHSRYSVGLGGQPHHITVLHHLQIVRGHIHLGAAGISLWVVYIECLVITTSRVISKL